LLIFATNRTITELKIDLLPDFYDRIVQHVVYIPPLRETTEDRITDWENIWKGLRFSGQPIAPKETELINWLNKLPLYGNYRDLQKIAIYFNVFMQFDVETKNMIGEISALNYAKTEFEKYHSSFTHNDDEKFNFNASQTTKEMIADYLFELQDWAIKKFKSPMEAEKHFRELGDTINKKSFHDWKTKKSINK